MLAKFFQAKWSPWGENWAGTARFLLHLWCILTAAFSVLSAGMHALVCIIVISWHGAIFCEYVDLNFGHQPLKKPLGPQSAKLLISTRGRGHRQSSKTHSIARYLENGVGIPPPVKKISQRKAPESWEGLKKNNRNRVFGAGHLVVFCFPSPRRRWFWPKTCQSR